jgi:hypothetical protein
MPAPNLPVAKVSPVGGDLEGAYKSLFLYGFYRFFYGAPENPRVK